MAEDYYKVLGVSRNAKPDEIEKAYRALAKKYHPDLNPDDKSAKKKFQEVQAAFDVLGDASKRELYDRYGSSFQGSAAGQPHGGGAWTHQAGPGDDFDFSQFFGERFGGGGAGAGGFADLFKQFGAGQAAGRGRRRARAAEPDQGADVESEAEIPFQVAVAGGEVPLRVTHGNGRTETLTVKVPAGVGDGARIRLRGQGEASPGGGPAGDLYLRVRVAPHPCFTRQGTNLMVKLPVTLREAAEGAKVDVPTPKGVVALRIPPGTSSGAKLRIKGYGVATKGKPAGDLLAEVQIILPGKLDEPALEVIRQIDSAHPTPNPREGLQW